MARQVTVATIGDFRSEFPEFPPAVISDVDVDKFLRRAKRFHTATKAGSLYAAAHLYCLDQASKGEGQAENQGRTDGGMGVITKETIGPKSVEYMTTAGDNPRKVFWATTPYGREFMVIEQRNVRQGFGIIVG
ncbi:MAG: DUF4054 domain-containing protein [Gammaproteobacteria bacterium AqS3]|nr:DUF4054 domain-containing protein [Gammaproteobacteria bacterium AqS3]